jgi:hypothetical protein
MYILPSEYTLHVHVQYKAYYFFAFIAKVHTLVSSPTICDLRIADLPGLFAGADACPKISVTYVAANGWVTS